MSALVAVVNAVQATPVPSPEVIIKTVEVIPAWVTQLGDVLKQLSTLGLLVIPGVVASRFHDFANPKLGAWANALLLFGYSSVLGLLGLIASDQLNLLTVNFANPEVVAGAILTVLGAASARYAAHKASHDKKAVTSLTEPATQL